MKNARRISHDGSSALRSAALASNSWAQQRPPILEQIAKTYGLDSYPQIEAIRYTWNGEIPGYSRLPTSGSGSPRPARSPLRARIKTVSR